mgnify:CR=1 FL=1
MGFLLQVDPAMEMLAYVVVFGSVAVFAGVGYVLFSQGWKSYEESYLESADQNLQSMFLTIPPQNLFYLQFLLFFVIAGGMIALSGNLGGAMILGGMGFFLPSAALKFLKSRRELQFKMQLVSALQALGSNLKSGFSLAKAFEQLEKEAQDPMRQEVRIMLQEMRLGTTVEKGVENMWSRMPSEDMDLISQAVNIASRVGGNLPIIFKQLEDTIRERARVEGKLRSLTSQGKFQAVIISALPAFVGVAMQKIYPEMMEPLFTTWQGWIILAVVIVMNVIGFLVIRKIVTIEI